MTLQLPFVDRSSSLSHRLICLYPSTLPCYFLSLDVMDESSDHVTDYDHDVFKVRLDADGKEIHREKATELSNKLDPTKMAGSGYISK
ncbi:hypothetical protein LRAMOSA06812 [Lichtheimia ramosa]|uniref:Uncharacterized protein n=1 Tax=Lichtheimia ramosa TaxID=688394 RepID=A0A077W905_9FUNG|nr:hypothetical protein LRAMOSA06812 [Lichtheimia ramosa]